MSKDHEPLPGVTVLLKGTTIGAATDMNGHFALELPAGTTSAQLVFSYIGYTSHEMPVAGQPGTPLQIELKPAEYVLGGDVVIINSRPPWPWRPRALYRWSRYQVTRSFRR